MHDLFEEALDLERELSAPLADRLRPKTIMEVVGQSHLLGEGKPLSLAFITGQPHSMIFWGPPGVGKTTLARLTASIFDCEFLSLSAVFSGVKEIRSAIETAKVFQGKGKKTLLFIDEIHRFNKGQQDALLPFVESGLIIFIGATTENPSFEINRALLSRAIVYPLQSLQDDELMLLLKRVIKDEYSDYHADDDALKIIVQYADGDARRSLNLLEQVLTIALGKDDNKIDPPLVRSALVAQPQQFDKQGENFYDQISALHKSVRGSNPDAALYWFSRMLEGGVDPLYLARRIIRIAWEDIGLADPRAMQIANDAATTYERLGSPEGELALAQAVIYLSCAAKSNAGYIAYNAARAFVKQDQSRAVPLHLRNAPTQLMRELDYGKEYRYAHDEPNAYAAGENYFPEGMDNPLWYEPSPRGLEEKIGQKLVALKQLDQQVKNK